MRVTPEHLFRAFLFGSLLALGAIALRDAWRARRNEQQLQLEIAQRRGWRTLARRGWLPEDLQ